MPCVPRSVFVLIVLTAVGCGEKFVQRPTQVSFDPASKDFWALPFPSDARLQEDGTFNLERYPPPRSSLAQTWITTADARLQGGWGLSAGAFFTLGGPLDESTLPATPEATLQKDAAVYLVDIDPASPERGRRFPLKVTFRAEGGVSRPDHLLALVPEIGFVRRPNTIYAAVVTDSVKDAAGEPLGRSEAFHAAFVGEEGAHAQAAKDLALLREFLTTEKLDASRVAGAAVFRTMDPEAPLRRLVAFAEALAQPAPLTAWEPAEDYPDFRVFRSTWEVPNVQAGDRPGHGRIQWGPDGRPVQNGAQVARLVLSIPKRPMPAGGFPMMMYLHGSGGEAYEGIDRGPEAMDGPPPRPDAPPGTGPASYLARRGIALLGFDFPLHGTRKMPPDTTGLEFYSLFGKLEDPYNIDQSIDNMTVAVMEVVLLSRLVERIEVPASSAAGLDAGGAADGLLRVNMGRLSAMGHSMGSTLGVVVAGVDPRIQGWVFSGSGGNLVEMANTTTYPVRLKFFVEQLLQLPSGEELSVDHPVLHLFQHLWDQVDPIARARRVAQDPHPERGPRPFLMTAGVTDGYFHPRAQKAMAVALGAPIVGATVEEELPRGMALAQRDSIDFPAHGNLNGVTAGVVQYDVPHELGHYIVFDTAPAQSQYLCFVEGVGTAAGPKIVSPRAADAACD